MKKLLLSLAVSLTVLAASTSAVNAFDMNDFNQYRSNVGGVLSSLSNSSQNSNDPYNRSGGSHSRSETLRVGDVLDAKVLMVTPVTQEATRTSGNVGVAVGGAIGGIAGGAIGNNTATKAIGGLIGSTLGALIGQATGEYVSERKAGEVLILLPNGKKVYVVQEDGLSFQPGQDVFVFESNTKNIRIKANTTGITSASYAK